MLKKKAVPVVKPWLVVCKGCFLVVVAFGVVAIAAVDAAEPVTTTVVAVAVVVVVDKKIVVVAAAVDFAMKLPLPFGLELRKESRPCC